MSGFEYIIMPTYLEPVEALSSTEKFLKVLRSGTFKNFSGFYNSAKCCIDIIKLMKFLVHSQFLDYIQGACI